MTDLFTGTVDFVQRQESSVVKQALAAMSALHRETKSSLAHSVREFAVSISGAVRGLSMGRPLASWMSSRSTS